MSEFEVVYLADHPEYTETCAAWDLGYWSVHNLHREPDFQRNLKSFREGQQKKAIPLTLLVMDKEMNRPVAMGSFWAKDSHHWRDKTPWVSSLFVHELYRKRGAALMLINAIEEKAKNLGFGKIYLTSIEKLAPFYKNHGYEVADKRNDKNVYGGVEYLFYKDLKS